MDIDTDVAIVGGGPVGAALALALRNSGLQVTVLEARPALASGSVRDPRPIALSYGSRLLLERMDVWQGLATTAIRHIHISQRGRFGRVALDAAQSGVPTLGYVVDYGAIYAALSQAARSAGGDHRDGARVTALRQAGEDDRVEIDYELNDNAATLTARLAVVADGGDIDGLTPARSTDYAQHALTARVVTARPHHHTAYERFTPDGPLALLPFDDAMALVWTLPPPRAQALEQVDAAEFLAQLHQAFGGRLGAFTAVTRRATYALTLRRSASALQPRVMAIGNAAQTLHPVAGQGFNLGLRDAWELAQCLHATAGLDPGDAATLRRFAASRRVDRLGAVGATHGLVRLFSNDFFALGALRGTAMTLFGCVPPARDFLARRMIFGARG